MNLGTLIQQLKTLDQSMVVENGFGEPDSYRGFYNELAFAPATNALVSDMLKFAEGALGKTFVGYKGGDYEMGEWVQVWVCEYGTTEDADVITQGQIDSWSLTADVSRVERENEELREMLGRSRSLLIELHDPNCDCGIIDDIAAILKPKEGVT